MGQRVLSECSCCCFGLVCAGTMASSPATPQLKISLDEIAAGKAMGSKNAPIRLEDFTDFECPACKYLFEHTTKMVIEDYVYTGKVYLIHHDFPLAMHQYSKEAAHWAECRRSHREIRAGRRRALYASKRRGAFPETSRPRSPAY